MENKLKEVTYLTLKNLKKHNIVLPETYLKTFQDIAKELHVDIKYEDLALKSFEKDAKHVENIVKKTNESLTNLNKSTSEARKAIENKDDNSLKKINADLERMQKQIDFLQKELFADPLTSAYNRKWFSDYYLKNDKFQNDGHIVFIDINNFKRVNDTYGHVIGDQVLKYMVKFLEKELAHPNIDIVRFAGDEFIILFNNKKTSKTVDANKCMQELQDKLSNRKLKTEKIKEFGFTFSYGITAFKKEQEVEPVLELVDSLMYKNKEANR